MKVSIRYSASFLRDAKALKKKYRSLEADLQALLNGLLAEPRMGESLGLGCYKIRLSISSKGRGKSGSARVISHVETLASVEVVEEEVRVSLVAMYDKSDRATITKKELVELIRGLAE